MTENKALLFYEQIASHLTSDTPPVREEAVSIVDTFIPQYLKVISQLGQEVIAAASVKDRKEFYAATTKVQGKIKDGDISTSSSLSYLQNFSDTQFTSESTESKKIIPFEIKSRDFEQYRQVLQRNFETGKRCGSKHLYQLTVTVEANATKVACRVDVRKWDDLLLFDKPNRQKAALADKLIRLAQEMESTAAALGLESFGNPMNGLSLEDHIRMRGEAISTRYEFGFTCTKKGVGGYDLGITYSGEHNDLNAIVRRLLLHDILSGGKVPSLGLSTLFALQGTGEAIHQRKQLKREPEQPQETLVS